MKYPKKCLEDLTTFSCLLDEGIPKILKKLNSHDGVLSYLQNSTANSAHLAAHFCTVLVCPQKATVIFNFFHLPHQVDMKNAVKSSKYFFGYFNTLETHSEGYSPKAKPYPSLDCLTSPAAQFQLLLLGASFKSNFIPSRKKK